MVLEGQQQQGAKTARNLGTSGKPIVLGASGGGWRGVYFACCLVRCQQRVGASVSSPRGQR